MAVPSHVSLLILYTNTESGAYSRDSSQCPQRCPYIFTIIHHRVSHDFIGSHNCVPTAFTAESPLCPNIITAVLLLYVLWIRFFPPTYVVVVVVSYVVFQNIPGYNVLLLYTMDRFLPPRLMPVNVQRIYCTVQYHMLYFKNIVITTVLYTRFCPPDFCPYKKLLVCPLHGKPY